VLEDGVISMFVKVDHETQVMGHSWSLEMTIQYIGSLYFLAKTVAEPFGLDQSSDWAAAETKLNLNLQA